MPKVSIVVVMTTSFCGPATSTNDSSTTYQNEMSSRPSPTTTRPITAPLRKATFRPRSSDCRAALAVRAEA